MADVDPSTDAIRLLGETPGKRILELGCGDGAAAIALARGGATVIAIDPDPGAIATARRASASAEVRLELHAGDLADLAFLRADSIDAAFSSGAFATVTDLGRVFRQVHRVLRPGAPMVFSLPHPVRLCLDAGPGEPLTVTRSYFDESAVDVGTDVEPQLLQPHSIGDVFAGLHRAGFRVDQLLEPEPIRGDAGRAPVPEVVLWRARKEGA